MHYYARKGEAVTCTNGHEIYVMDCHIPLQPLHCFAPVSNTNTNKPSIDCTPRCKCGAAYGRWTDDRHIELHFADGWRKNNE